MIIEKAHDSEEADTMNNVAGQNIDANCELLEEVLYGANMGLSACQTLMTKTSDAQMLGSLNAQMEQYSAVKAEAESELRARGRDTVGGRLGEVGLKLGVHVNTFIDSSPSHIAEMLIEGSTMGVIDITRARNRFAGAETQVDALAQRLLDIERGNIDEMEKRLN